MMARKLFTQLKEFKELVSILVVLLTLIGGGITFAWCKFAVPEVDKRIDVKMTPVVEALEFQNFLMMESLPDSVVDRATVRYSNSKRGSAR